MPPRVRERPAPDVWAAVYGAPVVHDDLVLLAVGWPSNHGGDDGPVLVALDAATGDERFRVSVPVERPGVTEGEVGRPVVLPDGRILVAVYQWDVSLVVLVLDRNGRLLRTDDLATGREIALDVIACDLGIKLWLEPIAVAGDAYLVSWVYRHRSVHVQCREISTGVLRWEARERLLAADDETVWCEDAPALRREGGAIVARALRDGTERARLAPYPPWGLRGRSAVGLVAGRFVLVERLARVDARIAREEGILLLCEETGSEDFDALEARWDREHPEPGEALVAVDGDGREAWRIELGGQVGSVLCAADRVLAIVASDVGDVLFDVASDGRTTRAALAPGFVLVALEPPDLWLTNGRALVCAPLDTPGEPRWEVALSVDPRVERATPTDRTIRTTAAVVRDGRAWLRDWTRLVEVDARSTPER